MRGTGDQRRHPPLLPLRLGRTGRRHRLPRALRATGPGTNLKIVHRAYAKKAQAGFPLELYEEANRKAREEGKIVTLQPEAEVPKVAWY